MPSAAACASSSGAQRAGAADHELGVGMGAQHRRHRVEQVALAGQRMQPLHVDHHVPPRQPEPLPQRGARRLVDRREALDHRRIGDAQARPRQPQRDRLVVQAAAVERDRRRAAIHRGEQVDDALRPVVPDLGAVEREHGRDPAPARQPRHHLGEQPVAVQVDQRRPRQQRLRFLGDASGRRQRGEAQRLEDAAALRRRRPRHRPGHRRRRAGPRRMRQVGHRRARRPRPTRRGAPAAARWRPGRAEGAA